MHALLAFASTSGHKCWWTGAQRDSHRLHPHRRTSDVHIYLSEGVITAPQAVSHLYIKPTQLWPEHTALVGRAPQGTKQTGPRRWLLDIPPAHRNSHSLRSSCPASPAANAQTSVGVRTACSSLLHITSNDPGHCHSNTCFQAAGRRTLHVQDTDLLMVATSQQLRAAGLPTHTEKRALDSRGYEST